MRLIRALSSLRNDYHSFRRLLKKERACPIRTPLRTRLRMWSKGFLTQSYSVFELDRNDPAHYLPDFPRYIRTPRINGRFSPLLNDKVLFHSLTRGLIPIPKHVGAIFGGRFVPMVPAAASLADRDDVIVELCRSRGALVVKPRDGSYGEDVSILKYDAAANAIVRNGQPVAPADLAPGRFKPDMIVTDFVRQAEYSRRIFAGTTNTIRLLTLVDPDNGRAFAAIAVHRFGSSKSGAVDNFSAGGYSAPINLETGVMGKLAGYPYNGPPVPRHDAHPETGERVAGLQVPHWPLIRDGLLHAAERFAFAPYIGWDVVVTDDGYSVIEGNNHTGTPALQVNQGLLVDERVERFNRHHRVLRGSSRRAPKPQETLLPTTPSPVSPA
jgi:hypothetical protein